MRDKLKQDIIRTRLENLNLNGSKKQNHRKWKNICAELSDRQISLNDIVDVNSKKQLGLAEVLKENNATLGDLVLLRQYSEAILEGSTRAAEFIRDTMGEKPGTQIDVTQTKSPIEDMSSEDLTLLLEYLKSERE